MERSIVDDKRQRAALSFYEQSPVQSIYTTLDVDFEKTVSNIARPSIDFSFEGEGKVCKITDAIDDVHLKELIGSLVLDSDKLASMNFAYFNDGILVHVPRNKKMTVSNKLAGPGKGSSVFTRTLILLEENSELNFSEEFSGDAYFANDVTECCLSENATLNFSSVQEFGKATIFSSHKKAALGSNSKMSWNILSSGSSLAKSSRDSMMAGEGSSVSDVELILTSGSQHIDSEIKTTHIAKHTDGKVLVNGVADEKSRQVAYGIVKIEKTASSTSSFLEEHSILLGKEAKADSIPALEILTNDVSAKHAATCSQIDEEKIFYLISRGISRENAKRLIIEGFISSAADRMHSSASIIREKVATWLQSLN